MSNPQNSIDKGNQALVYFQNRAAQYSQYSLSLDELKKAVFGSDKRIPIELEGLGDLIVTLELDDRGVEDAMEALADAGQGRTPTRQSFYNALGGKASEINWLDLTTTVASETVSQVVNGAQAAGNSIITGLSWINTLLPFVMVGAMLYLATKYSEKAGNLKV